MLAAAARRHQGDVYEGWFQVTFIIHLYLICISIPKNERYFFILIPKPAYKLKTDRIISFFFQGTKEADGEDYVAS